MNFICIVLGILFCAVGIIFSFGKIHIHLSAWKMMSQEEKEKIKITPLCYNIGMVIALSGVIFLLKGFLGGIFDRWFTVAMIAWFVIAGFDVWRISKSGKYQNV